MKPPRMIQVAPAAAEAPFALSGATDEISRLVALLGGEGLTRSTIQELLRPETAEKLRGILTDPIFLRLEDHNPGTESQRGHYQPEAGKVLIFKARKAVKP